MKIGLWRMWRARCEGSTSVAETFSIARLEPWIYCGMHLRSSNALFSPNPSAPEVLECSLPVGQVPRGIGGVKEGCQVYVTGDPKVRTAGELQLMPGQLGL